MKLDKEAVFTDLEIKAIEMAMTSTLGRLGDFKMEDVESLQASIVSDDSVVGGGNLGTLVSMLNDEGKKKLIEHGLKKTKEMHVSILSKLSLYKNCKIQD